MTETFNEEPTRTAQAERMRQLREAREARRKDTTQKWVNRKVAWEARTREALASKHGLTIFYFWQLLTLGMGVFLGYVIGSH